MAEITLANPGYLWVLLFIPLLVVIHFLTLRQSRAAVIKFSNFEAIERVAKGDVLGSPYRGLLKNKNIGLLALRALIYCLLIFAVAGTTLWYEGASSSFDYVVAIDASSSMLADDFKPTRFDAAKEAAAKFVDFAPKDAKIGIVTFSTTSRIELKPASNLGEVKEFISGIRMHQSGGTAIGDAIITSTNLFESKKTKAVILLTDGQSNVGIDPNVAVEYAKQNEITIHAIGVATKEGGNVSNLNIVSKIDEELLEKSSKETGGKFFIVDNIESLDVAFRQIASSTEKLLSLDISGVLLVSVVILLGLEWALINTLYKSIP